MKNADETLIHPVIIIGAGVCGLIAQSVFQAHGIDSLIIEKGRGLGGRCATRRGVHFIADHGPQFFNSRILASPFLNRENEDSIKSIQLTADSKNPRLIYPKGMSQLARLVSVRPEVLREERVVQVLR